MPSESQNTKKATLSLTFSNRHKPTYEFTQQSAETLLNAIRRKYPDRIAGLIHGKSGEGGVEIPIGSKIQLLVNMGRDRIDEIVAPIIYIEGDSIDDDLVGLYLVSAHDKDGNEQKLPHELNPVLPSHTSDTVVTSHDTIVMEKPKHAPKPQVSPDETKRLCEDALARMRKQIGKK